MQLWISELLTLSRHVLANYLTKTIFDSARLAICDQSFGRDRSLFRVTGDAFKFLSLIKGFDGREN